MGRATSSLTRQASRSYDSAAEEGEANNTAPSAEMAPPHHPRPSPSKIARAALANTAAPVDEILHTKTDPRYKERSDLARASVINERLGEHEVAERLKRATIVSTKEEPVPLIVAKKKEAGAPEIEIDFGFSDASLEVPAEEGEASSTAQLAPTPAMAAEEIDNANELTTTPTTKEGIAGPSVTTTPAKEKENMKQDTEPSTTQSQVTSITPVSFVRKNATAAGPSKSATPAAAIEAAIRKLEDEKKGIISRVAIDLKPCRRSLRRGNRRSQPCGDPGCIKCYSSGASNSAALK